MAVPIIVVALSLYLAAVGGPFDADPDYVYLLNGLNILRLKQPGFADHPGTPLQILNASVIAIIWIVRRLASGPVLLSDDVLLHPISYLTGINALLTLMAAASLSYLGRELQRWTGSLSAAVMGQVSFLLCLPVLISLPRVTPELLLVSLLACLGALLAPAISEPSFPRGQSRRPLLIGAILGACLATKITSAPLLLAVALLRGFRTQALALLVAAATTVLLTLPASYMYGAFLNGLLALATHSGSYGGGAVGLPVLSDYLRNFTLLFFAFPIAFVSFFICGTMRWWVTAPAPKRVFVICGLAMLIQFVLVAKQFSPRYALPAILFVALANAAAVGTAESLRASKKTVLAMGFVAMIALGVWNAFNAVFDLREEGREAERKAALLAKVANSGCLIMPYYDSPTAEFSLMFGNNLARGLYSDRLAALYPDFLSYDPRGFSDFAGKIDLNEARRRLSSRKCVYMAGSPVERFDNFGTLSGRVTMIAKTPGGVGAALAVYQISPDFIGAPPAVSP